MKILHVIRSVSPADGGPTEVVRQAQPALERLGHSCEIVCVDPADAPWLGDFPIATHALGPARGRFGFTRRLIPWLRGHAGSYDAVIVHGLWGFVALAVWWALRKSPPPYFVYPHGMLDPVFREVFPLKHWKKSLYWKCVAHRVARDAQAVLFTCREEQERAARLFRPYQVRPASVPCCVGGPPPESATDPSICERYPELRGKRVLLFLGRIHKKKGCDLLIEAFARCAVRDPALHLLMAGPEEPPDWGAALRLRARALSLESRITWPGFLSGNARWSAFRSAEAFVLPSYQENFGMAVVEAMACGTPVLISNRVNIWREIVEDRAGLAGEPGPEGTAELLERWLKMPAEARQAMGEQAAACFAARFRSEEAARRLVHVLRGEPPLPRGGSADGGKVA